MTTVGVCKCKHLDVDPKKKTTTKAKQTCSSVGKYPAVRLLRGACMVSKVTRYRCCTELVDGLNSDPF